MGFHLPFGDNQRSWDFPNFRVWEETPGFLFFLFFFLILFLLPVGLLGARRGSGGVPEASRARLEHPSVAHGAGGACRAGRGSCVCLQVLLETGPQGKLGGASAEESGFSRARLAPAFLVTREDGATRQGPSGSLSHGLWVGVGR